MKVFCNRMLFLFVFLPLSIFAQNTAIGTVTDKNSGKPIQGVNVKTKAKNSSAQTDADGKFKLLNVKKGDELVFSFLGYTNNTVTYNGESVLNVKMQESQNELKEVVVQIGYGTAKKKDLTGSVAVVSNKDFNKGPIASADQLLVGRTPGVRITTDGGKPDAGPNIRIRGGASLNANNNPLIVIDNVPIDNGGVAGMSNPFLMLNPNDIESFTILKDASATAIYGSRASNGVIIVTTKKGTSGKPQFNFSSNVAISSVSKMVPMMSGAEFTNFIETYHPSLVSSLGVPNENGKHTIYDTNWQDLIYRTSISTNNNFSARANLFKKVPFRASLGYTKNEGLVKTDDLDRYTASLKLSPVLLNDNLKVDVNFKGASTKKNDIDNDAVLSNALSMDPTKPAFDNSPNNIFGGYYQTQSADGSLDGVSNPLALLMQRSRPVTMQKMISNIELDYKMPFLKSLRAVTNLGIEASKSKILETYTDNAIATYRINNTTTPPSYVFNPGKNYEENQTITNKTLDFYLMYAPKMTGVISKFDIQGGYSYQNFVNDGYKENYQYNTNTGLRELQINPANPNNRYWNNLNLQSFYMRSNFDLANKYLFTISLRADGSSLFSSDKPVESEKKGIFDLNSQRWGLFPSAGFAWKMKDESFLKDSKTFSDLKLRLGYGITGQQDITMAGSGSALGQVGFYPYQPLFGFTGPKGAYFPGVQGYYAIPYNPNLTWEKTTTYNAGLDFALFPKNVVTGNFDVYQRYTTDLLSIIPVESGKFLTNEVISNVGKMKNHGAELNLNVKVITTTDFNLAINGNISYNRGEVTDLGGQPSVVDNSAGIPVGTGQKLAYNTVGQQPYSAWVFKQVYDANGKPIQNAFVDNNGDGKITDTDRYYVSLRPNWTYGFGLTANYKNLDLSTTFNGQIGGRVYNARKLQYGWLDKAVPVNSSSLSNVLNTDFNFINIQGNVPFSDYYLEDASFLRCQNITLGYKLDNVIKKGTMRVYASGSNLFLITKYTGTDPENFSGIDNNFYPRPRTFSLGTTIDF